MFALNTESTANTSRTGIAGIVVGSLLFAIICLFGFCFGIYFSVKAKKPCKKTEPSAESTVPESLVKLNYSAVQNCDNGTDSEQEERFGHRHCEYEPPSPLLQNDEETN